MNKTRLVESSEASNIFALAEWVLGIPQVITESVAVFPGLGEDVRVLHAIARWRQGNGYLLVAGYYSAEKTFEALTLDRLQKAPFSISTIDISRVITQIEATNTKVQAQWLVQTISEMKIHSCELHAPPYHLVRAFLTVIAAMDSENQFVLIPHPTPMSPDYVVPEVGISAVDMTAGEYQRIVDYTKTGDVASLSRLKKYLKWLWQQPEFKSFQRPQRA